MKNMEVYVLDTGYLAQDKSTLIAGLRMGTINDQTPAAIWTHTPVYAVLIKHPDGNVLFDTSCNPKSMTERWPEGFKITNPYYVTDDSTLPARLEQLKVSPKDIKYVVMSHMHLDHAGCLEMFTDSEIIVHEDEFTQCMKKYALNKDMGVYIWKDLDAQIKNNLNWNLFSSQTEKVELMKGLTIYNFGSGHSYGMLGLLVELPSSGNILLVADAIYTQTNFGPPLRMPGILYDSIGVAATIEKIRDLAKEKNATIWFGHDAEQFASLIKSTEGCYE